MPDDTQTPDNTARRPFAAWLQEQRNGALHAELTDALIDLTEACVEHGKPGTLTVQIKIKPSAEGYHLYVADHVKVNAPEGERPAALYFHDGAGNLSRRDPNQLTLDQPLRKIDGGVVDPETGEIAGEAQ